MKTTRIYIKSLKLQNIRSFGDDVELRLHKRDGTIPQWTLILGDNGLGKSTLLQCIAWMKPYLPYDSTEIDDEDLKPQPIINDEENETLERLVRRNSATTQEQSAYIEALFVTNRKLNQAISSTTERTCKTSMNIWLSDDGKLNEVRPDLDTNYPDVFYNDEILIYAYSASRQLGKLNVNQENLEDTIPGFIAEQTELYDAEEILHTARYAELGSEKKEKGAYKNYIDKIKRMLVSILPEVANISSIDILPPKLFGKQERQSGIFITTKYNKKIPFSNMSLGYKTAASWTIDLAWRLFREYPHSLNPLAEPAIVLIDEIDLHLHPVWQRQIMNNLSKHFKNTQFIATAHSPLMLQAAIESNYAVLKQHENGVAILNDPKGIDGWRVDQILTSEMFGLASSRGIRYEELYSKREKLISKKKLRKNEESELKTINEQLSKLPSGETPEEIENRELISNIASNIRKSNKKIKL